MFVFFLFINTCAQKFEPRLIIFQLLHARKPKKHNNGTNAHNLVLNTYRLQ